MYIYHQYLIKEIKQLVKLIPNSKVLYKLLSIFASFNIQVRNTLDCEICN